MPRFFLVIATVAIGFSGNRVYAAMDDDPLIGMVLIDRLEWRDTDDGSRLSSEFDFWFGTSLHKLLIETELDRTDGKTGDGDLELSYSRAISAYWDVQLGVRRDYQPKPRRNWLSLGISGVAPYFVDIDANLYLGESGRSFATLEAEYELLFTNKLILAPRIEIDAYGKDDSDTGVGSGLSSVQAGLRLRYEFKPEFAPYIGVHWDKLFGDTADFARAAGDETDDLMWVIGLHASF